MREEIGHRTGNADARRKIVLAALQLYCEIGHNKTTVSDIARHLSMSSANVYRFFPSKQAIEETVVGEVLEETVSAATEAARTPGPALRRLATILKAIADCNEGRSAKHGRLQDLVALAVRQNWTVVRAYDDRIRGLVRPIIGTGQASGELRGGSPMALTCCLLQAMDVHLNPSWAGAATLRPSFEKMSRFCLDALACSPSLHAGMPSHVRLEAAG
ncbi:TetR/AcrR family transcriptional regulator [Bradyrhizobium frederickii]|uniref:TetR/AcrR family transcriptional regulator n=1 Tax=Bradyrhizobium frederickii TaxID=2560054 RepID=A0A4Y9L353_9BRAD|nr:TetR/AcrR family transcriptional regulator [Bradyrhizobium frederickii]TFV36674.1 TetR/AcrR family transcriptional regulator [Bradyrhizobium frederickii]TFV71444.1 TetR/AcrR family transcriptional regulator [Bradyrhizobium frederickii]